MFPKFLLTVAIFYQCQDLVIARTNTSEDVTLQFYNTGSKKNYVEYPLTKAELLLTAPGFNLRKMTVFYFFGFEELVNWESVQTILDGYLSRGDHNVIIVDWSNMNQGNYFFQALPNCHKLAAYFATVLIGLIKKGLNPDKIHLVGHSLGAQLAGLIGKNLQNSYAVLIYRITHLDAAGPGFWFFMTHADKNDAKLVDSIHTDAGIMGTSSKIGKINFWPNKGKRHQPGCPLTIPYIYPYYLGAEALCSHWLSWRIYAESLKYPKNFPAKPCTLWRNVDKASTNVVYMGIDVDPTASGDYCLRTSEKSPYGLRALGIS